MTRTNETAVCLYMKRILLSLLIALCLSACASAALPADTPQLTATAAPTVIVIPSASATPAPTFTPTRAASPTPTCLRDAVLAQVRAATQDEEFSISYNEMQFKKSLAAWLVEPSINPAAADAQVQDNLKRAYTHAAAWVLRAKQAAPCLDRLFDTITVIVTDRNYNGWFSGELLPAQVPAVRQVNAAITDEVVRAFSVGYFRRSAPGIASAASAGSCTWKQAREKIGAYFHADRANLGYYFTIDDAGANVWAQWHGASTQADVDTILALAKEVKCMHPAVDQLAVTTVDAAGVVQMIGSLPKEGIQTLDIQKFQVLVQKNR